MAVNSIIANAASQIAGAIRQAARSTGISFEYLLTTAQIESNLNPAAQASTSSAKGLYQFIEQTWLGTMKQAGPAHRLRPAMPTPLSRTADGRFEVADPIQRAAIMRLRSDPAASATMAGAFTRTNAAQLARRDRPCAVRRRTLHRAFPRLRRGREADRRGGRRSRAPTPPTMFPQAAAANPSIFCDRSGRRAASARSMPG